MDDEQDVDSDKDEEGIQEDEGGDVEDEGDDMNRVHRQAEYLQSNLFDRILSEPEFWTSPKEAIKRAYRDTDDEILDNVVGSRGGSTAVTAILVDGEKLIVANVGDTRAILCRNGEAKQITVDHEPLKEKQQVESRGGFVSQMPGHSHFQQNQHKISKETNTGSENMPGIVVLLPMLKKLAKTPFVQSLHKLAMARAFGDERLKEHITEEPDVFVEAIDANTESIILASDGLWKVLSNQEVATCIKGLSDAQEASKELIKEAPSRKSLDDISCIVVMFD
ncbi:hypothetical protein RHGRI_036856 [Rhododendron griersonianum]|uniref:PPM-type phosphatase domain-containing protein n=1 Tax=Rhododendron griersonianum TaxID=479676 RepID=A0AAV6HVB7_9ERIC|nr:hypothetical protein RHGRI_036856 [Rhododendron griersonianum]